KLPVLPFAQRMSHGIKRVNTQAVKVFAHLLNKSIHLLGPYNLGDCLHAPSVLRAKFSDALARNEALPDSLRLRRRHDRSPRVGRLWYRLAHFQFQRLTTLLLRRCAGWAR